MALKNVFNKTLGKTVSIFIFAVFMLGIIYSIGTIAPLLDTGSTSLESFNLVHDSDNLTDSPDYEGWTQVSTEFGDVAVLEDGEDYGKWVEQWNSSEYDFDTEEVTFKVSFNQLVDENISDFNLAVESPETGEDYVHAFNLSNVKGGDGEPPYLEETVSTDELPNVSDTEQFETYLEAQRTDSNGTTEGELEVFEASIDWEVEKESDSSFVGDSILKNLGMLVLSIGGLLGLIVALFTTLTE